MKFGLFMLPCFREGVAPSLADFYDEMSELVAVADETGWARIWISEHHFHYYGGASPNPAVQLAAWARETEQIRLGPAISLTPLRNPLHIAEDYAVVDQLSGGRLDFGIGRGYLPHEFAGHNLDPDQVSDMREEGFGIIRRAWAGETFEHSGNHYSFPKLRLHPLPLQDEVPIWVLSYAPHIVYTNTPMMERTGVTEDTTAHGIGRYPDGRLNGWFIETRAVGQATRPVQAEVYRSGFGYDALLRQSRVAVRNGITTVADLGWGFESFENEWNDHAKASGDPGFPLRMVLIPFDVRLVTKFGDDRFDYLKSMRAQGNDKLSVHGVKFINDGSYPSMTLRLNFPGYLDGEEGLTGETQWADMVDCMLPYWQAGIQIHSHANGDQTVDMTLDTLAELQLRHPRFDHRFTVEHYCISTVAQGKRLAALGGLYAHLVARQGSGERSDAAE